MGNATAVKFGYPHTLVAETGSWWILLRPKQPTFGALVLVCKAPATACSECLDLCTEIITEELAEDSP